MTGDDLERTLREEIADLRDRNLALRDALAALIEYPCLPEAVEYAEGLLARRDI